MTETGGPTAHLIGFQDEIAALYLGRLIDPRPQPAYLAITAVQGEGLEHVDDLVVEYADGHRQFFQVKASLAPAGETWSKLWKALANQRWDPGFGVRDSLTLVLGAEPEWVENLQRLCERARSRNATQWANDAPPQAYQKMLQALTQALPADRRDAGSVWALLSVTEIIYQYRPGSVREDHAQNWMPASNREWWELFDTLVAKALAGAPLRRRFTAEDLRRELAAERCEIGPAEKAPAQQTNITGDIKIGARAKISGPVITGSILPTDLPGDKKTGDIEIGEEAETDEEIRSGNIGS
jgi:hypothetical protein